MGTLADSKDSGADVARATVFCCQCAGRTNSGEKSGYCTPTKEFVARKKSADSCGHFKKRPGVK